LKHSIPSGERVNLEEIPARQGFSVSYLGKTLLSKIDPVAQAERLAAGIDLKESSLYICPSPLYGYGLPLLLERLPSSSAILCVEADEKLFELSKKAIGLEAELLPNLPKGRKTKPISLVQVKEVESQKAEGLSALASNIWGERVFRRVETIRLTGGWQLFPQLYSDMEAAIRREIAVEWSNAMTLIRLGRLYSRNLIRNLAYLGCANTDGPDWYSAGILALGAGPSLDPFLNELYALYKGKIPGPGERRFRIICVGACLPALADWGILPDLVVILESQHWNLRCFIGSQGQKIDTGIDLSALPASTRALRGKKYFFVTPWAELAFLSRLKKSGILPETYPPMGSVGLNTVALALKIGSGSVITAGIDFSFSMDVCHARSTPGRRDLENRQTRFKSLINADTALKDGTYAAVSKTGEQVRSNPAMRKYRDLFEQEFGGNPRLFDIAGSGLPLGAKTITAAEAFAMLNEAGDQLPAAQKSAMSGGKKTHATPITAFAKREVNTLKELKDMLTGVIPSEQEKLEALLDTADYLWAHFPECAGAGGRRPPVADLSFLKRIRTEIDPFLKLWEITLEELTGNPRSNYNL
jgi:hypothetical protein